MGGKELRVTDDGGVCKIVEQESESERVKRGKVTLRYRVMTQGKSVIEDRWGEPYTFTLGRGEVIAGLELGVRSMAVGETSTLRIAPSYGFGNIGCVPEVQPGAALLCQVEICSVEQLDSTISLTASMTLEDVASELESIRTEGNDNFRSKKFREALRSYRKGLRLIQRWEEDSELSTDLRKLRVMLMGNMAACFVKLEDPDSTVRWCSAILKIDPRNVKAHYRAGCAYYHLRDWELAVKHLSTAKKLNPSDAAVAKALAHAQRDQKKEKERYLQKMFG